MSASRSTLEALGVVEKKSGYAWAITVDKLDVNLKGLCGPSNVALTVEQIRQHEKAEKFRVKDDDGEIYYYGYFVNLGGEGVSGFEPLDDYGRSLGATSIEYKTDGEYKQL